MLKMFFLDVDRHVAFLLTMSAYFFLLIWSQKSYRSVDRELRFAGIQERPCESTREGARPKRQSQGGKLSARAADGLAMRD
jgi:hypothetical protein